MSPCKRLQRLAALANRLFDSLSRGLCPTCTFSRALRPYAASREPPSSKGRRQVRNASTLASSTAINAQRNVPPEFQKLYQSLELLKKNATNYVDISRLRLALRSLESRQPTIRVAVLGLRDTRSARQLTRLLLADVLGGEAPWEKELQELPDDDRRGILLRYGEGAAAVPNPLVTTLNIPSPLLKEHKLEILISSLNLSAGLSSAPVDTSELRRTALVPTAETPKSFTGSVSFITYPVHRAIVLSDGIQGCLALGRYATLNADSSEGSNALKLAVNLAEVPRERQVAKPGDVPTISTIDVAAGDEAMAKFRETIQNATLYERGWRQSGVSELSSWLIQSHKGQAGHIVDPAVLGLITDLISTCIHQIKLEDEARQFELARPVAPDAVRQTLEEALQIWAMRAHSELRDELEAGFVSPNWSKLAWWKLLWRADDVTMIMSDVLERRWLIDGEKGMIWLSGRAVEAGVDFDSGPLALHSSSRTAGTTAIAPWPQQIPMARRALSSSTVPTLQALAQSLLLQTISVSSLAAALSAFIYVALPTASIYSTGAVAALGLVWSLRHLQKTWERARHAWAGDVREVGRVVLKETEETFRTMLVRRVGVEDDVATQDRRKAREAVEEVQSCLTEMSKKS